MYENILLVAPSHGKVNNKELNKELAKELLDFFDSGKNLFIVADVDSSIS